MLKKQALKKIFMTTLSMLIILTVYTIPSTKINQSNVLRTNLEIEDITNIKTDIIYLQNKYHYFVKTEVLIDSDSLETKIKKIIEYLTMNQEETPKELSGYIPKEVKLINASIEKGQATLDFSKELLNTENKKEIITGIVYSLLECKELNTISFEVEGNPLKEYTSLNKNIGINNNYFYNDRTSINKVVTYYLDNTNSYYVPVTNYINDNREKIEIIMEELKETKNNLISVIHNNLQLEDYKEEANVMFLNFNEYLLEENEEVQDKILKTIAYSVFDNYDVNMVMFEINNKSFKQFEKNEK